MTSNSRRGWPPILLDKHGLAQVLERSPHTLKRRMSKCPGSLPPMIVIGGKIRLFPRSLVSAWLAEDEITGPVKIDISALPPRLKADDLAFLLHLSESSISSMKSRNPESLPSGGKFGLWETASVFGWLVEHLEGIQKDRVVIVSSIPKQLSMAESLLSIGRER